MNPLLFYPMTARWLAFFLAFWLLAGPHGAGLHLHHDVQHEQHEQAHSHLASSFDAEHAQSHATGTVDADDSDLSPRSGGKAPPVDHAMTPLPLAFAVGIRTVAVAIVREQPRHTGPPPRLRPPGQAPPSPYLLV